MDETLLAGAPSWSLASTALANRGDAVREALGETHLPWDVHLADPGSYSCALAPIALGDSQLVECRSGPVSGRRSASELRRTEADTIAVLLVLSGRERVRQGEVCVELEPGDGLLWSSQAPIEFEVIEPLHKLTLLLPADRVASLHPPGNGCLGPRPLPGDHPVVRLLAGHLQTLAVVGAALSPSDALFAVDVGLDLLVRASQPPPEPVPGTSATRDLLARTLRIIGRDLADPDLTPARLAARLGITPRYLHMVFTQTDETVAAHIRRRRVERVRHDLADPALDGATVTDIAFRWGFSDSGHLSRVFRAEHGMSPSTFRAGARARRRMPVRRESGDPGPEEPGVHCPRD